MDRSKILITVLVLVSLFGLGSFGAAVYFFQDRAALQQQLADAGEASVSIPSELPRPDLSALQASGDDSEAVQALNAYIDKLEKENAAYKKQLEEAVAENSRGGRGNRERRNGPPNMEELKETNPEQYARFQEMRQRMEQRMQEFREKRDSYFANLDTSRLSAEQRNTLKDYQNLVAEMEERMQNPENRGDMRELGREMMEMRGEVQNILFDELGSRIGADGTALSDGVQEIMSVMGGGMGGGPGGFGGGPGGPGGFGGGPGGGGR